MAPLTGLGVEFAIPLIAEAWALLEPTTIWLYWKTEFPKQRILRNNLCLPACRILVYKRMALEI